MQRKLFLVLLLAILLPALLLASGKIRGKVSDAGTGEVLVGANVVIVGTSMGAATNVSGEFVVLNVPAGTYQLKTSYVGYQTITLSNLRVNDDLTSEANFQLPAEGVTVATVEIVAERPLVNKNATSAVRIIDAEFFEKFPGRGVNSAVAIQPGVVSDAGGNFYIRGGRADETGFQLEGVSIVNPLYGGSAVTFSAEAVEQVQVMAGSYSAEYGSANAGIVSSQLRTGNSERWKFSLLGESDRFTGMGKQALGGYSYGYSDYTATVSGPVSSKVRVFGSFENAFLRDPDVRFWGGLDLPKVAAAPIKNFYHPNTNVADTLDLIYKAGNRTDGMDNRYTMAGTVAIDLNPLQIRLGGTYNSRTSRATTNIANIFNSLRNPLTLNKDGLGNAKFSYVFNPTTFVEASVNYFNNSVVVEDPYMKDNIDAYGDSAANARLGFQLKGNSTQWDPWSLYGGAPYGISVNFPGTLQTGYAHTKQEGLGGRIDFTSQMSKHEIKIGGEYTRYTIRRFAPGSTFQRYLIEQQHAGDQATIEKLLNQAGNGADLYGYDIYGNEISNDVLVTTVDPKTGQPVTDAKYFGPPHPVFAGVYLEDKIEFSDLVLNLGLRYDRIDPDSRQLKDPQYITFNDSLGVISSSNFVKTPVTSQISPRLGFSFPVSDRTVFHAQFGKYIQQSQLRDSFLGLPRSTQILKGGFFVQGTSGYGLRPERTTSYEIGFAQQVSDMASFDVTGFYKDILDQITYTQVLPGAGATQQSYPALVNGDFATTKGIEFKFTLRRTNRIQAQVNYTLSDARGTGSNPTGIAGAAVTAGTAGTAFVPVYIFATTFNQPQRGSILFDYRFGKNDGGPVLEQLGLNVLFTFNSGTSFTRIVDLTYGGDVRQHVPIEAIGSSSTPWVFQIDARLDKTVKIGPLDANFYLYVINLLNTQNAVTVFNTTGDPNDNGWLASANGAIFAKANGPSYVNFYDQVTGGLNSGNFGPPRQIRFGVRLDY